MRQTINIRRGLAAMSAIAFSITCALPVWAEYEALTEEEPVSPLVESAEEATSEPIESEIEVIVPPESSDLASEIDSSEPESDLDSSEMIESGDESIPESSMTEDAVSSETSSVPSEASSTVTSSKATTSRYVYPTPTISPEWNDELNALYNNACDWLKQRQDGELFFIAMGCAGRSIDSKQYGTFLSTVSESTYTELYPLALTAMNATFCGVQATNVNGTDLISQILSFPDIQNASSKALAYALLALDSNPYELTGRVKNSRQSFVYALLALQKKDGSFQAADGTDTLSLTAIALAALSQYSDNINVRNALNSGVSYLQAEYQKTRFRDENSIVISRIITALTCLKVNINDSRFTRNGKNLCDQLLDYLGSDGGFQQAVKDNTSDSLSTESAIIALTSVKYFTSPYITRQTLPEILSSIPDHLSGPKNIDWHWWLLPPIIMLLAGCALVGIVIFKKKTQPEESAELEDE